LQIKERTSKRDAEMDYHILDWDTQFFGIRVAKIIPAIREWEQIREVLTQMGKNAVKLAYWASYREIAEKDAKTVGGHLVDKKTTFGIDLCTLKLDDFISTDMVEVWKTSIPTADLESLAVQSSKYSRFSVDPNVPNEKLKELYKIWLRKCLQRELADEVLIIRESENVVGMATLGEKNGKGDIGLIAVEERCRGRKFGEMLVRAAQIWFIRNGYKLGQVVTQGENTPSCNLYKKCGYSIERVEYFYHFWL
jgi:dTDP-4-amino-4,6-dideoxy-D-galactose acyltransferase